MNADAEPQALHPSAAAVASPALAVGATGSKCGLGEAMQRILRVDPAVKAALAAIPSEAMTPAGALMLWNGGWTEVQDGRGGASVAPLRRAIIDLARTAPPACRTEIERGPVFLLLAAPRGTIVVVLGTGTWRWTDLLGTAPPSPAEERPPA